MSVLLATGVAYEVLRLNPITEDKIESFVVNLNQETNPFRLLAN